MKPDHFNAFQNQSQHTLSRDRGHTWGTVYTNMKSLTCCSLVLFLGLFSGSGRLSWGAEETSEFIHNTGCSFKALAESQRQKALALSKYVQQGERLKLLAVLLALHHCVVGWRRLHSPGRWGGWEGQFGLWYPADRVLWHLPTYSVQPPEEKENKRGNLKCTSVLFYQCLYFNSFQCFRFTL